VVCSDLKLLYFRQLYGFRRKPAGSSRKISDRAQAVKSVSKSGSYQQPATSSRSTWRRTCRNVRNRGGQA